MSEIKTEDRLIVVEFPAPALGTMPPMPGWAVTIRDAVTGAMIPTVSRAEIVIAADATDVVKAKVRMFADEHGGPVYAGDAMVVGEDGEVLQGDFWFEVAMLRSAPARRAPRGSSPWGVAPSGLTDDEVVDAARRAVARSGVLSMGGRVPGEATGDAESRS
jgi:hypothetical protein